jgi:hypothetical protein
MKVIIVEVTRAANTFGRTHLDKIMQAYEGIARIVKRAQDDGIFRTEVDALFAAQAFYGLIEQVLTQWIFGSLPVTAGEFEHVKNEIVEMIGGGLDAPTAPPGQSD